VLKGAEAAKAERFRFSSREEALGFFRQIHDLIGTLKTPDSPTDRVRAFCKKLSDGKAVYLECQPEPWSRQSCCDSNVEEYVRLHGGASVFGYRIWFNSPRYIESESHAVWSDGQTLRDVSFVDTGEKRTLFVPVHSSFSGAFDDVPKKIRHAFDKRDARLVATFNRVEASVPSRMMSREEAWATMPSYEDWKAGKRMPNMIPTFAQGA